MGGKYRLKKYYINIQNFKTYTKHLHYKAQTQKIKIRRIIGGVMPWRISEIVLTHAILALGGAKCYKKLCSTQREHSPRASAKLRVLVVSIPVRLK